MVKHSTAMMCRKPPRWLLRAEGGFYYYASRAPDPPLGSSMEYFVRAFSLMEFDGEFDQAIDELGVRQSGRLPQLGVHADGSEAGNRVQFVDENFASSSAPGRNRNAPFPVPSIARNARTA